MHIESLSLFFYKNEMSKYYWLMKSEPEVYSIDQLKAEGRTLWTGVRNYQARNFMYDPGGDGAKKSQKASVKLRDRVGKTSNELSAENPRMKVGDLAFFYHSNSTPPGIAGLAKIIRLGVPDPTQFDPTSDYFDPKATTEKPIWFCAEVKFVKKFPRLLALNEIRKLKGCESMLLLKKGSRLSITPVSSSEARVLLSALN